MFDVVQGTSLWVSLTGSRLELLGERNAHIGVNGFIDFVPCVDSRAE